jgi:hypothetical protein
LFPVSVSLRPALLHRPRPLRTGHQGARWQHRSTSHRHGWSDSHLLLSYHTAFSLSTSCLTRWTSRYFSHTTMPVHSIRILV